MSAAGVVETTDEEHNLSAESRYTLLLPPRHSDFDDFYRVSTLANLNSFLHCCCCCAVETTSRAEFWLSQYASFRAKHRRVGVHEIEYRHHDVVPRYNLYSIRYHIVDSKAVLSLHMSNAAAAAHYRSYK